MRVGSGVTVPAIGESVKNENYAMIDELLVKEGLSEPSRVELSHAMPRQQWLCHSLAPRKSHLMLDYTPFNSRSFL